MAAALAVVAVVKAVQAYENLQGQIQQSRVDKAAGYATANANEERVRQRSAHALGTQRAAAVESGFDASTGSLATIQTQSAGNAELDALTERYKGALNAVQADQRVNNARAAFKGAGVSAVATLFGGSSFSYSGDASGGSLAPNSAGDASISNIA